MQHFFISATIFLHLFFSVQHGNADIQHVPAHSIPSNPGACPTDAEFERARENITSQVVDRMMTPCGGAGWRRVAYVNMSDPNQSCPTGLRLTSSPFRLCGRTPTTNADCNSAFFSMGGSSYSKVCGRITGFHQNLKYAFYRLGNNVEHNYVDGVSLTHGSPGNRRHIWSFAVGLNNVYTGDRIQYYCPGDGRVTLPSFITNDYFCDS